MSKIQEINTLNLTVIQMTHD